jgi:hypothetical protein
VDQNGQDTWHFDCPDGGWRWELHVPKGSQQDYMKGFASTEAEAEAAGKKAQMQYERQISN